MSIKQLTPTPTPRPIITIPTSTLQPIKRTLKPIPRPIKCTPTVN